MKEAQTVKANALCLGLLLIVCAILASPAAGQASCYGQTVAYVRGPMNIRKSHSTSSPVVQTAAAGQSFAVSSSTQGSRYCWLELAAGWMARTTRVAASQPAQSTAASGNQSTQPSDINNCCFVNRRCQSENEWLDGYWAFQRNECPVSMSTPVTSSPQPVSVPSSDVNNCCYTGWQCTTDEDWQVGYYSYASNLCQGGLRLKNGQRGNVIIEGSLSFRVWINAAFDLLQQRAPQWYRFALGGLRKIKQLPPGTGDWMGRDLVFDSAWDSRDWPSPRNVYYQAAVIVHEACHGYQFMQNRPDQGVAWEVECLEKELQAQLQFDPNDRFGIVKWVRGLIEKYKGWLD